MNPIDRIIEQSLKNESLMNLDTNEDIDSFLEKFPCLPTEEKKINAIVNNVIAKLKGTSSVDASSSQFDNVTSEQEHFAFHRNKDDSELSDEVREQLEKDRQELLEDEETEDNDE